MTTSAPNAAVPTAALDGTERCRRNEGVPRLMNAEGFVVATSAHAARQFALFDETGQWFLRVRRPVHRPANARRHGVLPRALLESVPSGAMQRWSHPQRHWHSSERRRCAATV